MTGTARLTKQIWLAWAKLWSGTGLNGGRLSLTLKVAVEGSNSEVDEKSEGSCSRLEVEAGGATSGSEAQADCSSSEFEATPERSCSELAFEAEGFCCSWPLAVSCQMISSSSYRAKHFAM